MSKNYRFIQLRTKACKNFSVQVFNDAKFLIQEEGCVDSYNTVNTYLDAKRARELAFALLSAAKKIERKSK
jgi:hypothetical protein